MTTDPYAASAARFASDTAHHEMTILHDDGLYRHLRFKQPDRGAYWFDLVTWPGALAFTGDVGSGYVFRRLDDMCEFFRNPGGYSINPSYWAEKVVAGKDGLSKYSTTKFQAFVDETVVKHEDEYPGLGKAITEALSNTYNPEYEEGAREFLRDFIYATDEGYARIAKAERAWRATGGTSATEWQLLQEVKRQETFEFSDTWELDFSDWDWQYLWACQAIRWGIGQYDKARKPATVAVAGGVL